MPLGLEEQLFAVCGDHIAYFWETDADFASGGRILETGLLLGDYCVVFGHQEANDKVLALLRAHAFAVDELIAQGRLAVLGGHETGELMLAEITKTFTGMLAAGAPHLRLLGNLGWGRPDWPGETEILAFEARVTDAVAELPCIVVCMYDVRALPGHLIVQGGFGTHPYTLSASRRVIEEH